MLLHVVHFTPPSHFEIKLFISYHMYTRMLHDDKRYQRDIYTDSGEMDTPLDNLPRLIPGKPNSYLYL